MLTEAYCIVSRVPGFNPEKKQLPTTGQTWIKAGRIGWIAGRLGHDRFFSQGIFPKIPEQNALIKEAEALYIKNLEKEKAATQMLAKKHRLSPEIATQAARQMMLVHEKTGLEISTSLQKAIMDICKKEMPRVDSYRIPMPLVPGAREEWKSRCCQRVIEGSLRERDLLLSDKIKAIEQQTWRDILAEQKPAVKYQKEQQHKIEREKNRTHPRDFGLEL